MVTQEPDSKPGRKLAPLSTLVMAGTSVGAVTVKDTEMICGELEAPVP